MSSSISDLRGRIAEIAQQMFGVAILRRISHASSIGILMVYVGLPMPAIGQNDIELFAKPESCVALHRGQQCFLRVHLSWTEPMKSELCLYASNDKEPLHCGPGSKQSLLVDYTSSSTVIYSLRIKNTQQVLAEAMVRTVWVYRTGRRSSSSWRLF